VLDIRSPSLNRAVLDVLVVLAVLAVPAVPAVLVLSVIVAQLLPVFQSLRATSGSTFVARLAGT
jgi:hypothetical protein